MVVQAQLVAVRLASFLSHSPPAEVRETKESLPVVAPEIDLLAHGALGQQVLAVG